MKKVIFCLAAVLALLSCSKRNADPTAPTISWGANASFAIQEMGDNMDGTITVSCPSGIASLQIKCTEVPDLSKLVLTQWISIQTYKSSLTMDLLTDASLTEKFTQYKIATPIGRSLIKAPSCTIDFKALLDAITKDFALENGTRFTFEIMVSNTSGNVVTKTASFRWTAAATFPENAPSIYWLKPNDDRKLEMNITVPGKVSEFIISFEGPDADPVILKFIETRSLGKSNFIDLVNDTNVEQAFKMQPVIKNAAMVNLSLSGLMLDLGYECGPGSSTDMVITVKDALGKVSSHTITLLLDDAY